MSSPSRPLLTFALVSCNQEPFVREAVQSALAQSYSPLQIILSDDCSDDRSFEIMCELAATYRGPHQLQLNRNPSRKIMGGHLNRVLELAQGELIVIAAADDVSLPERTQVVYEAWEDSGRAATSLFSDLIHIDDTGARIKPLFRLEDEQEIGPGRFVELKTDPATYVQSLRPTIHGCSHAFCPRLYRRFGNLPDYVVYEDKVLGFRSVLGGKIVYINEPLVRYRLHGANLYKYSSGERPAHDLSALVQQEDRLENGFKNSALTYTAMLRDLDQARRLGILPPATCDPLIAEARNKESRFALMHRYLRSGIVGKCRMLLQLQKIGLTKTDRSLLLKRLMPRSLFLRVRQFQGRSAAK